MIRRCDLWMVDLITQPTASPAPAQDPVAPQAPPAGPTAKYLMEPRLNAWRVTRDGAQVASFVAADEAVAHACDLARQDAHQGVLGLVVAEGGVKELHCFTPLAGQRPAGPRLRVVAERKRP